jgi:glutathione synthase/RimK-type ligase-like ATP-grasp enzyme
VWKQEAAEMLIAIHYSTGSFSARWIEYCDRNEIQYKSVNCYSSDIVDQLQDCDALMWHFSHLDPRDVRFAKQLMFSVQAMNKRVFPDFYTMWHFDDKVGQKYLLEAIGAPLVSSYVFYSRQEALCWAEQTTYPKVFKLRSGAGSLNVRLVKSFGEARKLIARSFGRGYSHSLARGLLHDHWNSYRTGKESLYILAKGVARYLETIRHRSLLGQDNGYIYFQDFIPGNDHDIRVVVVGDRAFAIKRLTRVNDFRASGSGRILYEKEHFHEDTIRLAFDLSARLSAQCMAYDFVFHNKQPFIVEISYGFDPPGYRPCTGYWDRNLVWHDGEIDPYGWMVESVLS